MADRELMTGDGRRLVISDVTLSGESMGFVLQREDDWTWIQSKIDRRHADARRAAARRERNLRIVAEVLVILSILIGTIIIAGGSLLP